MSSGPNNSSEDALLPQDFCQRFIGAHMRLSVTDGRCKNP